MTEFPKTEMDEFLEWAEPYIDNEGDVNDKFLSKLTIKEVYWLLQMIVTAVDDERDSQYYHNVLGHIASHLQVYR